MNSRQRGNNKAVEKQIRAALEGGDTSLACTLTIERYGSELFGFIRALTDSPDSAEQAFSLACEDIWRGIDRFAWQSSLRTWLYVVTRRACARCYRGRSHPVSAEQAYQLEVVAKPRTKTETYLRTEVKDAIRELRAELSQEDQALLILRIDRKMSFRAIAEILRTDNQPLDAGREEAAQRKRFQRVKERLRALAEQRGLLDKYRE